MRPGEFLILTARPPIDHHNLFHLEFKPFAPVLRSGQHLAFDLKANPVVSISEIRGQRGKRHDVVMHALRKMAQGERTTARDAAIREAGASWLARKAEIGGFSIDRDRLHIDGYDKVRIPRDGTRAIVFSSMDFQGVLTVHDPARFLAGMLRGFGAAKAFGCGLILIRRASA
jgi:CRISPR system Cascade subunit CasE